jgi:hypothetical protein
MNNDKILTSIVSLGKRLQSSFDSELPFSVIASTILDWQELCQREMEISDLETAAFRGFLRDQFRRLTDTEAFYGGRTFSLKRLEAVTGYIASQIQNASRAKLNTLLFYSDFVSYFLEGSSISGSRYVHTSLGPQAEHYDEVLKALTDDRGRNSLDSNNQHDRISLGYTSLDQLTLLDVSAINWVLDNVGSLSLAKLSEISSLEYALRFTYVDDFIPYHLAKHFHKLPDPPRKHLYVRGPGH